MTPSELEQILRRNVAVVGMTGAGKTYGAKAMVEAILSRPSKLCVVDPTGVWHGLRSRPDGSPSGLGVVVLGGRHGDVELPEEAGNAVAEALAGAHEMRVVLDVSEMTRAGSIRILTAFLETLYRRNRGICHVVVDEADQVAPQNPLPESRRLFHEVDRVVRRGRARGFASILVTQRPAVLHKDVLSQCHALLAYKLMASQDRMALEAWMRGQADVERGKALIDQLPTLPTGDCFAWAPEVGVLERTRFGPIATMDTSRTPEPGEEPLSAAPAPDDLIADMRRLVTASVPDAAGNLRATDRDESETESLRSRIRQLESQLSAAERMVAERDTVIARVQQAVETTAEHNQENNRPNGGDEPSRLTTEPTSSGRERVSRDGSGVSAGKRSAARRMHDLLVTFGSVGLTRHQLAVLAGIKKTSGHLSNSITELRREGLVREEGGRFFAATRSPDEVRPPPATDELLAMWNRHLGKAARRMLEFLIKRYPKTEGRTSLAAAAGLQITSGHVSNSISELRTAGLVEQRGKQYRAAPALFPDEIRT